MHIEPELLALLALGEAAGSTVDRDHLATCRTCAGEMADLGRVVELARGAGALTLVHPGPQVWADVRRTLAARRDKQPSGVRAGREGHARLVAVQAPWSSASGRAELTTDATGRRLMEVSLHADLPSTGVRQAWLVHRDDPNRRQTLGILDRGQGLWTVEHALDLEQYAILEISQQSIGSSEHSGQTIVRGELLLVA